MDIIQQQRHGVSFYACPSPAWSGTAHGFSTRLGGVSPAPWESLNLGAGRGDNPANVGENFSRFCAAVGADVNALVKNHQVHSARIRPVTRADILPNPVQAGEFQADGLVSNEPGVCLTIFSGDCIPILLYDPVRRCVAAAHAGWRGTAAGIAARAVDRMVRDYGCQADNILAAIGPGIGPCCFETHDDVPNAMRSAFGGGAEDYIKPRGAKWTVDLKAINAWRLREAGAAAESCIYIGDMPTDVACANRAGAVSALAVWNQSGILCPDAQLILQTPADLLRILDAPA